MTMLLSARNISKHYDTGPARVNVLSSLNFDLESSALAGIYGASGSGKSTLLHVLGTIDRPDSGTVSFSGRRYDDLSEDGRACLRNKSIGFVFQFYYLLPEFSALENVMIPCMISGMSKKMAMEDAKLSLEEVSLFHRANHRPGELSGGEQQRIALARAIVMRPKILLADEPTGNLDRENGEMIFDYLLKLNMNDKIAMVIVSHNQQLLDKLPKKFLLQDGKLNEI